MLSLRSIQRINPLRLPSTHSNHPPYFEVCRFSVFMCIRIFMFICLLIFILRPSILLSNYSHVGICQITNLRVSVYSPNHPIMNYDFLYSKVDYLLSLTIELIVIFSQLVFSLTYFLGAKCKIAVTYNGLKQLTSY